ncbi:MAG: hypothetical protein K2X08_08545 [Chlamydiales bacterium]|nr:hypothetical protein [Chlamydiales bacterium]
MHENIHTMCCSKEFIQNPKDAIINWLINDFQGNIMGGDPKEQAFSILIKCIPNFEEAATIEYLETFGEHYFAQSLTRDQCMDILKKQLSTASTQHSLERFLASYNRTKNPAEGPRRCLAYAEEAQTDLKIVLKAFRHAQQLRIDELVYREQAE